jgi:glycosyltransferase involved in cell wall biosynthesis
MSETGISVAVIAKDEADRISRLLESVAFADEVVVVVDSISSDDTVPICRRAGARVVEHAWEGYARQKQFALTQARSPWVLSLDADEAVSAALAAEMVAAVDRAQERTAGFSMPRLSRYLGRWIRHGGWYPDRKVRLVRHGSAAWSDDGLHEKLTVKGEVAYLKNPILHYVYRNISDQVQTIDRFSDLTAAHRPPSGGWFLWLGMLHAMGKFIECYLWKRGFLDGHAGLVIAMNSSWYVFLKHSKTWEKSIQ